MLTKDDLQAIESLLDRKFGSDISEMKDDISGMKIDISGLKSDVSGLKQDVSGLKQDVSGLKQDVAELKETTARLDTRVANLEQDMRKVKVDILENQVLPRLDHIEQCYLDTSKRYIESTDKFDAAIVDIGVMKLAIRKNSEDIQKLKQKKKQKQA